MTGSTLRNEVVIVTGAGQGIGRGIGLVLAERGYAVGLVGRTQAKLESVQAEIATGGGTAEVFVCDVGNRTEVDRMVAEVAERLGGINHLINNAQSYVQRSVLDTTDADVELAHRSGPMACLYTMQACFPYLCERGGVVVNFATSAALTGDPSFASYAMAKEAIRALTRVAAREWGEFDVRVNCVCPSGETPLSEAFARDYPDEMEALRKSIPLRRRGDPRQDLGGAIAALLSRDMNQHSDRQGCIHHGCRARARTKSRDATSARGC